MVASIPQVVPDLLRLRVVADPGGTALVLEDGRSLSYQEWDERSNAAGRGLSARGAGQGDTVGLVFDNRHWDEYAAAYIAVHKAGAAAVPMAPDVAGPDMARILRHSCAVGVICPTDLMASLAVGPAAPWVATVAELEEGQATSSFQFDVDPSDLAEVIYTSGTTGEPKGVACSHASILVHDGPPEPEGPRIRLLHAFPVGTNAAQEVLRITLRRGDRVTVTMHRFDPQRCTSLIEELRVERLQLVPSMAQVLVASGCWRQHDMSSVEVVTLSSAPAPPTLLGRLAQAFPRARLVNAYALTESGTARTLNLDARSRPTSVGRPVGLTEVRITDPNGQALPVGQTGEVWLRRPGAAARSYFGDPAATEAAFAGGWLHTGDLGFMDGEGELHLVDRSKDIIICGGLNVSTVEVENVLYEHPYVVEAAVVGVDHEVLGQDVTAAVVVSRPTEGRELQAFARLRLAEHKVPHRIAFVDRLPRTASGKVRKAELAPMLSPGRGKDEDGPSAAVAPPASAAEESIVLIWKDVLGVEEVGRYDDFFETGGHSLAAVQVLARIEEAFGVRLPISVLFERPTVAELASAVSADR